MKDKNWSSNDLDFLIENYETSKIEDLAKQFERTEYAIRWKASELKLTKPKNYWTREETDFLVKNLSTLTHADIADKLKMNIGYSFVYPVEDRQTIANIVLKNVDKVFKTKNIDGKTRRIWRLL